MSEFEHHHEQPHPAFAQLESIVRAAGKYVQPTDDLRPNALEAVRDACQQQRRGRRLGGLAVLVLLFAATGFPDAFLSRHAGLAFVQSSELHRRASRIATDKGVGSDWALYEVFSELRREKADLLNHSD